MSNWIPRNDYVLVRIEKIDPGDGIAMPDTAIEGKRFVVAAVGPKVEDLALGDEVLMKGDMGVDCAQVPRELNLVIIQEKNVLLVREKE